MIVLNIIYILSYSSSTCLIPVSYTHLDVYKRQALLCVTYDEHAVRDHGWESDKKIEHFCI